MREVAGDVVSPNVRSFERLNEQMQEYYANYCPSHLLAEFRPGTVSIILDAFVPCNTFVGNLFNSALIAISV